jgi:hypothetical protein
VAASSLLVLTIEKSISANGLGSNAHALERMFAWTPLVCIISTLACSPRRVSAALAVNSSDPTQYGYGDTLIASIAACERYYFLQYIIELRARLARSESPEPIQIPVRRAAACDTRRALEQQFWIMTFIIEATKDDHHTVDIRSTAIVQ